MKPVVILDANALHGRRPFTLADSALLLHLARTSRIQLILPEVVLHELSRQWAEHLDKQRAALDKTLDEINSSLIDVGAAEVSVGVPAMGRTVFYDHAVALLRSKNVEIAQCPDIPARDLLTRDLEARKPFSREGKGFRDALIWETIRAVCDEIEDRTTPLLFVTNNSKDFCDEQSPKLHADLLDELPTGQRFEVINLLKELSRTTRSSRSQHCSASKTR